MLRHSSNSILIDTTLIMIHSGTLFFIDDQLNYIT